MAVGDQSVFLATREINKPINYAKVTVSITQSDVSWFKKINGLIFLLG